MAGRDRDAARGDDAVRAIGRADQRGHGRGVPRGHGDGAGAYVHAIDPFCDQRNRAHGGVTAGGCSGAGI
jgi:hypothetical protein